VAFLLDKRLVFVTGKGGVGKTTVAACLARVAARRGKRVIVCEVAQDGQPHDEVEVAGGDGSYQLPPAREEYAGVILSLARQENPETSGFNDPEIFLRIKRHHHAGLILRSGDPQRVKTLLENYGPRFVQDFLAVEPPREKPTA